jgi:RND superfamily putative drug exporter
MSRWTQGVYRGRWAVLAGWLIVSVLSIMAAFGGVFGSTLSDLESNRFDLPGTESDKARAILEQAFKARDDSGFTIVFASTTGAAPDRAAVARAVRTAAEAVPHSQPSAVLAAGPHVVYASIATTVEPTEAERYVAPVRNAVHGAVPETRAYVTGAVAINKDTKPIFDSDAGKGFAIGGTVALAVLLFIFGTAAAAVIPLVMAFITVPTTLGAVWIFAHFVNMPIYVNNLVELIGVAIAIDYSLLIVYRFREELPRSPDRVAALSTTMRTAGHAVLFSGITVAIGLALLVVMPLPFIRSMGIAGLMIPLVSLAVATTMLPALLGVMGPGVNRLRVVRQSVIEKRDDPEHGAWARLATAIMRRPLRIALPIAAALVLLAIPTAYLSLTPGSSIGLPTSPESVRGLHVLEDTVGPGTLSPAVIVLDTGHAGGAGRALPAVARFTERVKADPEVAATGVQSPSDQGADTRFLIDPSGRYLRVIVPTKSDYGTDAAKKFVGRLRGSYIPGAGFGSTVAYAGGASPTGVDFIDRAFSVFPWLVAGVLVITYLVLVRAFRSIVLPLKAVILNVVSILATYGLLVLTFKFGAGQVLGLRETPQIEAWIPIFLFAMLFGLSMDYEVFLLTRIREIYDETGSTERAVTLGLEKTGRIVTAAAAIMVAAFSGFVLGSLLGLQQFGWGLATAIAIDATIIRALLVPSLMAIMGDWNWYFPGWVARLVRVPSEPESSEA